jgi:3-dehydroquinate dehydratase/shikimate dehydrogenase
MMLAEIQEAGKRGARMIELRLDFLSRTPDFKRLLANKPCPVVATIRRQEDGGRWTRPESERLMMLRTAIVSGFDWVDLESDVIDKVPRFGDCKRIVSYHNFRETPADLEKLHAEMCKKDADVVKIATTAQTTQDNLRVLNLLKNPAKPTVAFTMGDLGTCTRVLTGTLRAPFTYGAFNKERTIAPGILSFMELQKIFRYESLGPTTQVFGVIGDPVGHSLSPLIHNAAFDQLGLDAVYVPFRVPKHELTAFLAGFQKIPVKGFSVTIPHKEAVAKFAAQRDPLVDKIGAANTLLFDNDKWLAANTDAQAAIESLKAHCPDGPTGEKVPLSKRTVLLLGAGGVARALAFGLRSEGTNLIITNRTHERAEKLAEAVGCRYVEWAGRHNVICDTVVNCTSVGMHPNIDECPVHNSFLKPGLLVFDTIYTPETTLLVREAKMRGCHVLTGVDMFVRQAALQFKMFTGKEPPIELMTTVVRRALSPVNYAKAESEGEEKPEES